jgi:hypothetical protein
MRASLSKSPGRSRSTFQGGRGGIGANGLSVDRWPTAGVGMALLGVGEVV